MMEYPILVAEWKGDQALTIICEWCGAEEIIDPDDIQNEGLYECPAYDDTGCRGSAVMKYEQADRCKGCGALGFWRLEGCCSRRCVLQAEYARQLRERAS